MDTSAILFDVGRLDDTESLAEMREDVVTSECYSEDEKAAIVRAIEERCSWLNKRALEGGSN